MLIIIAVLNLLFSNARIVLGSLFRKIFLYSQIDLTFQSETRGIARRERERQTAPGAELEGGANDANK